jgi:hypothetical protein
MAGAIALSFGVSACGNHRVVGTSGRQIGNVEATLIPTSILDLNVVQEDIRPTLAKSSNTYVGAAGLFSMRRDNVIQATLEVARLTPKANAESPKFREVLAEQIGGSKPQTARIGTDLVYFTSATKQRLFVWFRDRSFYVLSVRSDYTQPRDLLRAVLGVPV